MDFSDAHFSGASPRRDRYFAWGVPPLLLLAALSTPNSYGAELVPRDAAGQSDVFKEDRQKRQAPAVSPPPPGIEVAPSKRAVKPIPGLKVDVKGFRFSGLTVVPPERLQPLVRRPASRRRRGLGISPATGLRRRPGVSARAESRQRHRRARAPRRAPCPGTGRYR